jgi:hypothetical protein
MNAGANEEPSWSGPCSMSEIRMSLLGPVYCNHRCGMGKVVNDRHSS